MKNRIVKWLKRMGITLLSILLLFIVLDKIFPVPATINFAPLVEARNGTILHAYLTDDQQWRFKTRLHEITPELKKAIIFKEDKYFYKHFGVNPLAISRALVNNLFKLKRTSGASTITMQVARLLEPKPRSYLNKMIELFRATQLEFHYNKNEILQLYLNLVPYGSNIQGVKAASLIYFNKSPDQLSLAELTALSIIPNRPNSLVMGKDNDRIIKERNKWLYRFDSAGIFSKNSIRDAVNEPLTAYRHNAPNAVTQFAYRMKKMYPGILEIRTTIDEQKQLKSENIVSNYVNQLKLYNINNASVLVIDNKTYEALVYIGSSDFKDRFHYGQVDGIRAIRSPGSTLKPLLYGLCFDAGIITPKTVISDVPINIKGYTPENYDKLFRGNITLEYALKNSLNIPAVKLLDAIGTETFVNRLSVAGFSSITQNKKKLGLSVILGGCGVRLEELTALYTAFANDGNYLPISYIVKDTNFTKNDSNSNKFKHKEISIVSPSATYMLTKVMCELHRPDLPNGYEAAEGIPKIAWKTGTSYGRKDAWSIGYNRHFTIGVWLGNFSGQGVPELSGATTATPLLFQLFNAIDHNATYEWLEPPKELSFRLVCQLSGKVPNDFCTSQIMDYYIPGISDNKLCDHFKEVWISSDEKISYCTSCLPPNGYKTKLMENISPELASYYDSWHISYKKIPEHNPACSRTFSGQAPIITSLTNGMTYLIMNKNEEKLELACNAGNDVSKVYWYINNQFFASAAANKKLFFSVSTTKIKISCSDDKGRTSTIDIKIKFI